MLSKMVCSHPHAAHPALLHFKPCNTLHRPLQLKIAIILCIYIYINQVKPNALERPKKTITKVFKVLPTSLLKVWQKAMVNQPNLAKINT